MIRRNRILWDKFVHQRFHPEAQLIQTQFDNIVRQIWIPITTSRGDIPQQIQDSSLSKDPE